MTRLNSEFLSDGSKVYNVEIVTDDNHIIILNCINKKHGYRLIRQLDNVLSDIVGISIK